MTQDISVSSRPGSEAQPTRYPLHLTLASVFVTLFVVFGLVLIWYNNWESRRMAILGAEDLVDRVGVHMQTSIAEIYQPAQGLVDVAAMTLGSEHLDLDARLELLPPFAEALRLNPDLSAIFLGYEDGDFFLVRSLQDRELARVELQAPESSWYAIQSIERQEDSQIRTVFLFVNEALEVVERRSEDPTGFDPRQRSWYQQADASQGQITTEFYAFFTTGEVGLTLARRLAAGGGVLGADLALGDLSEGLARNRVTASTRLVMMDGSEQIIALSDTEKGVPLLGDPDTGSVRMPLLSELEDPVYGVLARSFDAAAGPGRTELLVDERKWLASITRLPTRQAAVFLATLIPRDELLAHVDDVRNKSLLISGLLLAMAVGLVFWVSRKVAGSVRTLAREAEQIRRFRLSTPVTARSRIAEVDEVASAMGVMKSSLQQFFAISLAVTAEKDVRKILEMVLGEARKVSHADGGAVLVADDEETELHVAVLENEVTEVHLGGTSGVEPEFSTVRIGEGKSVDSETVRLAETVSLDDLTVTSGYDVDAVRERFDTERYTTRSLLSIPLRDQKGEIEGLLQLVNARGADGEVGPFDSETVPYIEALSAVAAVALDLRRLIKAQKDLLESFTQVVAGAIDAKSPYTHGHCQRVPEIARMLAEAAHDAKEGPFAEFRLSDEEWEELHMASWLHDCGKVTTPEYVVDKATRLETITDRIHEVRTRFEVLWRDAEVSYFQTLAQEDVSGEARDAAARLLKQRQEEIREDFEFVAQCNLGETFMDEERIEHLQRIGSRTFIRHLDDRIGISHEELARREKAPAQDLPATESVLADRLHHRIERPGGKDFFGDNAHGFQMEVPELLYNNGELYNLSIPRGTLTAEERFKINEHIIQTISMLGRLPFPKELARVPEWAGNHHEKLDGTGYPRRLPAKELSVQARIMAIADIFEALTATDRPYHRPKSMSLVLKIMSSMRNGGHICPDLFDLFLESHAWQEYGQACLNPEQLDGVDLSRYRADQGAG